MKKKGASLIWAMVMSVSLLFIAATTATFVIKESQMSIRMDDSSRAYAAAESGITWGRYCVDSLPLICDPAKLSTDVANPTLLGTFKLAEGEYRVSSYKTIEGQDTKITLSSRGITGGVNRQIEYVIKPASSPEVTPNPLVGSIGIAGSYVQQFDYMTDGSGVSSIGVGNNQSLSAATKGIYFEHSSIAGGSQELRLVAKNSSFLAEPIKRSARIPLPSNFFASTEVPTIRVRIEYFKDLSAKMTVSKFNFGTGAYFICMEPNLVLDLSQYGITSSDLTSYLYSGTASASADVGDRSVYKIISGANFTYFDNMATTGISATALPKYTLTTISSPNAAGTFTVTVDGKVPTSNSFDVGTKVVLTANPATGKQFSSWSAPCSGLATTTVTMDVNKTCTANFTDIAAAPLTGTVAYVSRSYSDGRCKFTYTVSGGKAPYTYPPPSGPIGFSGGSIVADGTDSYFYNSHSSYGYCNAPVITFTDALGAKVTLSIYKVTVYEYDEINYAYIFGPI